MVQTPRTQLHFNVSSHYFLKEEKKKMIRFKTKKLS